MGRPTACSAIKAKLKSVTTKAHNPKTSVPKVFKEKQAMINPTSEEELTFIKLENESDLRTDEIFLKDFILKNFFRFDQIFFDRAG